MKVSVIIPVWNQEILLKKAVESIPLNEDLEVIIVDDGSTDDSYKVAKQLAKQYDNISVYHFEKNKGVSAARNLGLDKAKGEYIFMLDSDDYVYTEEFIKSLKFLDGTDFIYFNIRVNNGEVWEHLNNPRNLPGTTKFMKKECIGDIRYNVAYIHAEDYFFNEELLTKNSTKKFIDLIIIHYNYPRKNSLTWNRYNKKK